MKNHLIFNSFMGILFLATTLSSVGCANASSTSGVRPTINPTYLEEVEETLHSKFKLEFDEEDNFKVMILADVHAYQKINSEDRNNIENLIDRENPNLVSFTRDNTNVSNEDVLRVALDQWLTI